MKMKISFFFLFFFSFFLERVGKRYLPYIALTCIGRFKVVLKANEVVLCETKVGLLHRVGKLNLILKFQPNRTCGF